MALFWALSPHQDGALGAQCTPAEAVKASRLTCVVSTLAHSQRSNFQPVLNFKHMSNPTCFTEITHALKIKPCSAAVLEWDQRSLSILHQAHQNKDFSLIFHDKMHVCEWSSGCGFLQVFVWFAAHNHFSVSRRALVSALLLSTNVWALGTFPERAHVLPSQVTFLLSSFSPASKEHLDNQGHEDSFGVGFTLRKYDLWWECRWRAPSG